MTEQKEACTQCGVAVSTRDCPRSERIWCSDGCLAAWESADPERARGWLKVGEDVTCERVVELLGGRKAVLQ